MGESTAAARERARRWYAENRERANERARQRYAANREAVKERSREYREANLEAARERQRQYNQEHPERQRARSERWKAANQDAVKASGRRYGASLRTAVFDHYGWACTCCGSTKRLSIDHVNGDGREHREQLFGSNRGGRTFGLYRWLIASGFPDGFQTLCKPCNGSKRDGERCRLNHQEVA